MYGLACSVLTTNIARVTHGVCQILPLLQDHLRILLHKTADSLYSLIAGTHLCTCCRQGYLCVDTRWILCAVSSHTALLCCKFFGIVFRPQMCQYQVCSGFTVRIATALLKWKRRSQGSGMLGLEKFD